MSASNVSRAEKCLVIAEKLMGWDWIRRFADGSWHGSPPDSRKHTTVVEPMPVFYTAVVKPIPDYFASPEHMNDLKMALAKRTGGRVLTEVFEDGRAVCDIDGSDATAVGGETETEAVAEAAYRFAMRQAGATNPEPPRR